MRTEQMAIMVIETGFKVTLVNPVVYKENEQWYLKTETPLDDYNTSSVVGWLNHHMWQNHTAHDGVMRVYRLGKDQLDILYRITRSIRSYWAYQGAQHG